MMAADFYVNALGAACVALLDAARPPESCGPEIPVAPGRGPMVRFTPREVVRTDAGNYVSRKSGYLGRDAARVADAFDRMELQARRAHRGDGDFVPLFSPGQIAAGRDYAALTEKVDCSGLKCSSLEAQRVSSSGGGDREEAVLADIQRLRALQARIGNGLAKELRRFRPSDKRRAIFVRALVDQVCLGDKTLGQVLEAHGWGSNQKSREAIAAALSGALDRMQGYDLVQPVS
jgi:hypothetical protein